MDTIASLLYTISYLAMPLLLAMVLHEYAHGWVANRLGDPTARLQGRLTMNPRAHIDPFGTIIFPLMCLLMPGGFFLGWARPVPVDPSKLREPRRSMAYVAAAGPAMNLALALGSALLYGVLLMIDPSLPAYWPPQPGVNPRQDMLGMVLVPLAAMATYSIFINVVLMAFNLIPIPPLDGGRIMASLLPKQSATALTRVEPYGMLIIVGLIVLDPQIHVIGTIMHTVIDTLTSAMLHVITGSFVAQL